MEPREMARQMIDFQKQIIDSWHEAAVLMENQASVSVNWMMDTAGWMPDEGRKTIDQWMSACKTERSRLKIQVDQGLSAAEKIFVDSEAPVPPKNKTVKKKKETPNESI